MTPKKIRIEYLHDEHKCETCGWSDAYGGRIFFDEQKVFEFIPVAGCCNDSGMFEQDLLIKAFELMGIEYEQSNGV